MKSKTRKVGKSKQSWVAAQIAGVRLFRALVLSAITVLSFGSCQNSVDVSDNVLFGLTAALGQATEACTTDITITTKEVSIVEDGDVTALFDPNSETLLSETDADGGTAWGYRSFETCIYPAKTFSGTIEIPVSTNGSYSGRLTSILSYTGGAAATDPIPSQLTFTSNGVAARQCFQFTRIDDGIRNPVEDPLKISLGKITQKDSSGSIIQDGTYQDKDACDITVTMDDDEAPGIRVSNISRVMEEPGVSTPNDASFKVRLRTAPTANVTVTINDTYDPVNANNREGTASPKTLTFTPANFATEQTVTVTSVDDLEVDGLKIYTIQLPPVASSDPEYNGLDPRDVVVYNRDQSVPGYVYERFDTTGGSTDSSGGTISGFATDQANNMGTTYSTFKIKLRSKPSADVTLNFSTNCAGKCNLLTSSLTFTTSNWSTYQTVQVEGASDGADTGNADFNVTFTASSADATYNSTVAEPTFVMRSCDNDNSYAIHTCNFSGSSLGTSSSRLSQGETGGNRYIWLITKTAPSSDITVPLSSSDTSEGTVPASVTITSSNYNTMSSSGSNRISLDYQDDSILDGNINWSVVTGAATGGSSYNPVDIYARTTDNEQAYYIQTSGSTKEGTSNAATIYVCLGAQNTGSAVTLNLSCSGDECGTLSATSITFPLNSKSDATSNGTCTASSTNVQSFTVTGADDTFADGSQNFTVLLSIDAGVADPTYSGKSPASQTVSNADNEPPGKAIFVPATTTPGEMTAQGVLGADNICSTNKPSYAPSGTYKALIMSAGGTGINTRTSSTDWVLTAGYYYYRCIGSGTSCNDENQHLFVANGSALIPGSMDRGFTANASDEFWTGMTTSMTPATQSSNSGQNPNSDPDYTDNCAGWTYQNDPDDASAWFYGQTWTTDASGNITSNTNVRCDSNKKIICVQQ